MEQIVQFFQHYGTPGLFVVSFLESFCSPLLPDLLLIPMAISTPEKAIYYSLIATVASVLGGLVGYWLGNRLGLPIAKRIIPQQYISAINGWIKKYGAWAVFILALAPIPYKFVSISAGVFKINLLTFLIASILGRAKRFLLLGVLIYYYGPQAVQLIHNGWDSSLIWLLGGFLFITIVGVVWKKVFCKKIKLENQKDSFS